MADEKKPKHWVPKAPPAKTKEDDDKAKGGWRKPDAAERRKRMYDKSK